MAKSVRVRIAPSPTGFAHVGTAYTALFNYAFARSKKGKFIIRIEDSDTKRNVKGAEEKIYEALEWLGIDWDEGTTKGGKYGPYRLSDRLSTYKKKAQELVKKGFAYEDEGAIRFKNPGDDISWNDIIRGEITFPGNEVTDFVLLKSDGYPTYNFNVVVDDNLMKITHVIRGEDHISNTPRQIALYKAFGYKIPEFAHHPLLLNKDRKKLSKRDAAVDVFEYKSDGYLPEAFVNFLCLLGWSHPKEEEIFNLKEFLKLFSLDRVRKSGPIFDLMKLDWMNGQYIQNLSDEEFAEKVKPFAPEKVTKSELEEIAPLIKTRMKKLSDFNDMGLALFKDPGKPADRLQRNINKKHLKKAQIALNDLKQSEWSGKLDKVLLKVIDDNEFNTGRFFMSLRIAIFASRFTPPVNDSMKFIGKKETISRLNRLTPNI